MPPPTHNPIGRCAGIALVHATLLATTSTVPPRAAATNWTGAADGPVRFYRVRSAW
jgi:hypothetical protein